MKELLKKAKETKTMDELKTLLSESNLDLDEESMEKLYTRIHSDEELSDEELEGLSGGARVDMYIGGEDIKCPKCHKYMHIDRFTRYGKCHNCGYEVKFRR